MKALSWCIFPAKLILLSFCIYATTDYSVNPKQKEIKHPYSDLEHLYFTNISLYFTILASVLCLLHRAVGTLARYVNLALALSPVFNYITTIVFWSLYFIKRELIVCKKYLCPGYETYLITELSLHLFPLILVSLEHVDFKVRRSRSHYYILLGFVAGYCVIVHIAAWYRGCFLYPFLHVMPPLIRIFFFIGMYGLSIMFYNVALFLNSLYCIERRK